MLKGKTALVSGASRGIGRACAVALAAAGARVVVTARSESDLGELCAGLPNDPVPLVADLAEDGAAEALAERVLGAVGGVDILVNNAGVSHSRRAVRLAQAEIDDVLKVNLRAPLLLASHLAPTMIERGSGSIINVSSIGGISGMPWLAVYAATKAGLDAITRSLAAEWGPSGVRVNAVAPGLIDTALWEPGRAVEGTIERLEAQVALRRWGTAEDVAEPVVFLASDASRYITGQTIVIDGGLLVSRDLLPEL